MKDLQIKGTGNSRYLKTIATAASTYPTFEAFIAALVDGTFPIDLNGINNAGIDQLGTPLNVQTLLKNLTATALGLTSADPTVDDAFQRIAERLSGLEGRTVRLLYTASDTPTAAEIAQFVTDSGYTENLAGIAVVVAGTYHIWHYYEDETPAWRDDGVDTVIIDAVLSASSTNPVQNKVIYEALQALYPLSGQGAPTTSTVGHIGQLYVDTTSSDYIARSVYILTMIDGATYYWKDLVPPAPHLITKIFTTSQEWTAPAGIEGDVLIRAFGGGGGGGNYGGGGGGYMATYSGTLTEGRSYTITVGEGGAKNAHGGASSFGGLCTANGGARGVTHTGGAGGSGGGGGGHASYAGAGGNGAYGGGGGGGGDSTSSNGGKGGTGGTYGGGGGGGGSQNSTGGYGGTGGAGGEYGGNGGAGSSGSATPTAGNNGTDTRALDLEFTGQGNGGTVSASTRRGGGGGGGYGGNGGNGGYSVGGGGGGGGGYGGNGGNGGGSGSYGGGGGGGYGGNGRVGSGEYGGGGGGYGANNYGAGGDGNGAGTSGIVIVTYTGVY